MKNLKLVRIVSEWTFWAATVRHCIVHGTGKPNRTEGGCVWHVMHMGEGWKRPTDSHSPPQKRKEKRRESWTLCIWTGIVLCREQEKIENSLFSTSMQEMYMDMWEQPFHIIPQVFDGNIILIWICCVRAQRKWKKKDVRAVICFERMARGTENVCITGAEHNWSGEAGKQCGGVLCIRIHFMLMCGFPLNNNVRRGAVDK